MRPSGFAGDRVSSVVVVVVVFHKRGKARIGTLIFVRGVKYLLGLSTALKVDGQFERTSLLSGETRL